MAVNRTSSTKSLDIKIGAKKSRNDSPAPKAKAAVSTLPALSVYKPPLATPAAPPQEQSLHTLGPYLFFACFVIVACLVSISWTERGLMVWFGEMHMTVLHLPIAIAVKHISEHHELLTVFGAFTVYWVVDLTSRLIWPFVLPAELFKSPKAAMILGRHTMDVVACILFIYLAVQAEKDPKFQKLSEASPLERTYHSSPKCQLLILCQIAYQVKNTIDSYVCNDGVVFYLHHIGTGILCCFGLYPFLHAQAPFFLGHVEISTALLCVLGLFDDDHGVVGLGAMYPKMKITMGVVFAPAFIVIRIIIWPYLSYYFWLDMLDVYQAGQAHSEGVIIYSLVVNAGLTLLQFYWLLEIILTAKKEFGEMLAAAAGSSKAK